MPLYTADALVLRTYKLGESDRIVVFLTEDRGKKRGVAKGARRPRSRFTGALEPLTQARIAYFEWERRELVGLNYAEPARSPLAGRPDALGHVGYFAELLDQWSPEGDPSERLYRLGASMTEALAGDVPIEVLARYFEFWLLRLQGVYPSLGGCDACGRGLEEPDGGAWLAAERGVFTCGACAGRRGARVSPGGLAFLRAARRLAPRNLGAVSVTPGVLGELERVHRVLMDRYLERELRSTRVLRDLRRLAVDTPARAADSRR